MPGFGNVFLVAASLGMDNFAAAIGIGAAGVDRRTRVRTAVAFGLFESGMPLIGQRIAGIIGNAGKYCGAGLLIIIGIVSIYKAMTKSPGKSEFHPQMSNKQLAMAAAAISIDNLLIGFALSLEHSPILLAAGVIAIFSVTFSLTGMELGHRLGKKFGKWGELAGGIVLAGVGIAMGFGFL
jgi:putative Mn2+ efflux pump MntP